MCHTYAYIVDITSHKTRDTDYITYHSVIDVTSHRFIGKVVLICLRVSVNLVYKFKGKPGTTTVKHDFSPNGLKFHRGSPWVSILSWLNLKANKDYFSYEDDDRCIHVWWIIYACIYRLHMIHITSCICMHRYYIMHNTRYILHHTYAYMIDITSHSTYDE